MSGGGDWRLNRSVDADHVLGLGIAALILKPFDYIQSIAAYLVAKAAHLIFYGC